MLVIGLLFGLLILVSVGIFFKLQVRSKNDGSEERLIHPKLDPTDYFYQDKRWFREVDREPWLITSADGLKLQADFIQHIGATKTVILIHGYRQDREQNGKVAALFYQLGYNVLLPDSRGHGQSAGKYIGFGWSDRQDYTQWVQAVIDQFGSSHSIIVWGISMGAATTMMLSGEKLPSQVKAFIADCGYTSLADELKYQFHQHYLPSFPLLNLADLWSQLLVHYHYSEVSAVQQLRKNTRPILFIHGQQDTFVPFKMMHTLIKSTSGPYQQLVVKDATHANAFRTAPEKYRQAIINFLTKYV